MASLPACANTGSEPTQAHNQTQAQGQPRHRANTDTDATLQACRLKRLLSPMTRPQSPIWGSWIPGRVSTASSTRFTRASTTSQGVCAGIVWGWYEFVGYVPADTRLFRRTQVWSWPAKDLGSTTLTSVLSPWLPGDHARGRGSDPMFGNSDMALNQRVARDE